MQAIFLSREEVAHRARQLYENSIRQKVETEENIGKMVPVCHRKRRTITPASKISNRTNFTSCVNLDNDQRIRPCCISRSH